MESSKTKYKLLLVLDFDNTIIDKNTSEVIISMLSQDMQNKINNMPSSNWAEVLQIIFDTLKTEGVSINQIKKSLLELKMNDGIHELFEYVVSNKKDIKCIIISGATTVILDWFIAENRLELVVDKTYSNIAEEDEDRLMTVVPFHLHDCTICDVNQCKRIILNEYLDTSGFEFEKVFFVGDGYNDYCPGTILREKDILFARKDYTLSRMLKKEKYKNNITCTCVIWKKGDLILEKVKEVVEN